MDILNTIEILEALASGCSPETGELVNKNSVLNERQVIRALQIAISELRNISRTKKTKVEIKKNEIQDVIKLLEREGQTITSNKLATFFNGTRKFKNALLVNNDLYGKYKDDYLKGELVDYFNTYIQENNLKNKSPKYREIDYFQKPKFNNLSERAKTRLLEKIKELGIKKTENLAENVLSARINHPRAYETWSKDEKQLLFKVLEYTNDLTFLSTCFQRGVGAIESYGQRLIYEFQTNKV